MPAKARHAEPEFTLDASSLASDEAGARRPSIAKGRTRAKVAALAALALVLGAGAIYYYYWPRTLSVQPQTVPTPPAASPAPVAEPEPAIKYPVDKIPVVPADSGRMQSALPALDSSDTVAKDAIETILNGDTYIRLLTPNGIVRHIVATIDNLPRKTMAARIRPVVPAPGPFATTVSAHGTLIAGSNADRYTAYVNAAESIDTGRLVQFYLRLYPLFQQAYVELGYPDGYFNDRLIGVIDHLLAAPEPMPPVRLSQPKIMFEFADPGLEDLSAGQKILVRIGIDNELRLKAKLRDVRKALTGKAANP
jgi:hypothetical protein